VGEPAAGGWLFVDIPNTCCTALLIPARGPFECRVVASRYGRPREWLWLCCREPGADGTRLRVFRASIRRATGASEQPSVNMCACVHWTELNVASLLLGTFRFDRARGWVVQVEAHPELGQRQRQGSQRREKEKK
jgi:hypothetical protein